MPFYTPERKGLTGMKNCQVFILFLEFIHKYFGKIGLTIGMVSDKFTIRRC